MISYPKIEKLRLESVLCVTVMMSSKISSKPRSYGSIPVVELIQDEPSMVPTVTIGCWLSLKLKLKSLFKTVTTPPPESRPRFSTVFSDWTYDESVESDDEKLRWSLSELEQRDSNFFRMSIPK